MKQEDKELLLKDLCARLPYGVKVQCKSDAGMQYAVYDMTLDTELLGGFIEGIEEFKSYLRPISSMTEEENVEFQKTVKVIQDVERTLHWCYTRESYDWLDRKMFDYRGLIPKNLAIEVTSENNPYK